MKAIATRFAALLALVTTAACGNWLTDPEAAKNPNQPTAADINRLFVGSETAVTLQYTSDLARTACMWIQQCAGTERQYQQLGVYSYGEDAYNAPFAQVYTGGGLIDIRRVESLADSSSADVYGGIARVLEAFEIGLAADVWGDIPYSEAVGSVTTPKLDPQEQVYQGIQAKLDTAITMLETGNGNGPGTVDLYYDGDPSKWARLAHTLKARYFLHVAERSGATAYASALTEAQQGLQQGDDFLGIAAENPQSQNAWYQFTVIQRSGYMFAGAFLVGLLQQRNDPRLQQYFTPNGAGDFLGANPGDQTSDFSGFTVSETPGFRQPIVTWQENELIIAEASFRAGNSGAALSAVNTVRTDVGLPALASVTLTDILEEKYIVLFQNPEVWNDYKRTCYPDLTPAPGSSAIPGRLLYGVGERNSNPNVPAPEAQPARNWNDPTGCT
ncbi:MAG: SusD/RagB family nutrient-binding outer membrane lipoprotein [Gemmatimonadaceae bacterium]